MKWFVDLAKWNILTTSQVQELVDNGCCGFAIKGGQGAGPHEDSQCANHVEQAVKFGLPYILYHWVDPILSPGAQVEYIMKLVEKYKPHSIAPDIEQYWMSWEEWYKVVVLKQPGIVRAFNPDQLVKFYRKYLTDLKSAKDQSMPMLVYSAKWFFDSYAKKLAPVVRDLSDGYWHAGYVTWHQLDQDPNVTWEEFHRTVAALNPNPKMLPAGITSWTAWQFAVMPRPGWAKLDCNIIRDEDVPKFFGEPQVAPSQPDTEPSTEPEPEPITGGMKMVVIADTLNVRTGPSKSFEDIGDLPKGTEIVVADIDGASSWVRIAEGQFAEGYACVRLGNTRYLDVVKPE